MESVGVAKNIISLIKAGLQKTGCVRDLMRHDHPTATTAIEDQNIMLQVSCEVEHTMLLGCKECFTGQQVGG